MMFPRRRVQHAALMIVVAVILIASVFPILYACFGYDLFSTLNLTPSGGIGIRKWTVYAWFYLASFSVFVLLLFRLRKSAIWWVTCSLLVVSCLGVTTAAYRITQVDLFDSFYETKNRNRYVYTPVIPSLNRLYLDKSWKKEIKNYDSFFQQAKERLDWLSPELEEVGLSKAESQVVAYMLFVSSMWAYGNAVHLDRPGCVLSNEQNGWLPPTKVTALTYSQSEIGCCTDYAYILKSILDRADIKNRLVATQGHIFNEAMIQSRWYSVDANTTLFVDRAWSEIDEEGELRVFQFPHPSGAGGKLYRPIIPLFQKMRLNLILKGIPGFVTHPNLPACFSRGSMVLAPILPPEIHKTHITEKTGKTSGLPINELATSK